MCTENFDVVAAVCDNRLWELNDECEEWQEALERRYWRYLYRKGDIFKWSFFDRLKARFNSPIPWWVTQKEILRNRDRVFDELQAHQRLCNALDLPVGFAGIEFRNQYASFYR